MTLRVVSYGGGVQSTALLVLAAQGQIDFKTFLFCNVGDDSESPDTLRYVREVAVPYAVDHGLELHELRKVRRNGETDTLLDWSMRSERSIYIPLRIASGAPGNRSCTGEFKIDVIGKWLKEHGATADDPAQVAIGISLDEFQRATTDNPRTPYEHKVYPLIERRMFRHDCEKVIRESGLPVPPKSACFFCPYHRTHYWQRMKQERPDLFEQCISIEQTLRDRSVALGRDPLYLTRFGQPLDQAIGNQSAFAFESEDTCESGYCMT